MLLRAFRCRRQTLWTEEKLRNVATNLGVEGEWVQRTTPPTRADLSSIGTFIQVYCVGDFNARKAVNAFRKIRLDDTSNFAGRLNDADVLLHLGKEAEHWTGDPLVRKGVLTARDTLEMHRIHRHHLAHWVIRRLRGFSGFVALTANSIEAVRRDGEPIAAGQAKWALFPETIFTTEMAKLKGHSDYLGRLSANLETNADQLRRELIDRTENET